MAVTLDVPYAVLLRCRDEWDASSDDLRAGWRRLGRTATDGLSPEVVRAVDAFTDTWVDAIKLLAGTARAHSEDFVFVFTTLRLTDAAEAENVRSLLPWVWRVAEIEG